MAKKERKEVCSIRIEPWRKEVIMRDWGSMQNWVNQCLDHEFAGTTEAVIVRRGKQEEVVTEDDF